jgi:hypothetical protein
MKTTKLFIALFFIYSNAAGQWALENIYAANTKRTSSSNYFYGSASRRPAGYALQQWAPHHQL